MLKIGILKVLPIAITMSFEQDATIHGIILIYQNGLEKNRIKNPYWDNRVFA